MDTPVLPRVGKMRREKTGSVHYMSRDEYNDTDVIADSPNLPNAVRLSVPASFSLGSSVGPSVGLSVALSVPGQTPVTSTPFTFASPEIEAPPAASAPSIPRVSHDHAYRQ